MKQYSTFIFDSYAFDEKTGKATLSYSLDDEIKFEEIITFPIVSSLKSQVSSLQSSLFGLHLICGISYFKTCLPKKIEIRSGSLDKDQAKFWNTVYTKGLGEFFYKNDIDFRNLINFPVGDGKDSLKPETRNLKPRILVPFGGGKDSFVTAELLRKQDEDVTLLRVGAHPLIEKAIEATGLPSLTIDRKIAPKLLELNEQGALNGHIPITAIVSWISVITALMHDFAAVMMSNEKSASAGNAVLHGMEVNHQWSKGEEFERMMAAYVKKYVHNDLLYASALRDLTELKIAQSFTKLTKYLPLAVSCNKNWRALWRGKADPSVMNAGEASASWCGECPKCAFIFALYAAFLPKDKVVKVFGKNLFTNASLSTLYRELLGLTGTKPFDCVGTPEETREAFRLAHERGDFEDSAIMKLYLKACS